MKSLTIFSKPLSDPSISTEEKLQTLFTFLRPSKPTRTHEAAVALERINQWFKENPEIQTLFSSELFDWLKNSKFSTPLIHYGIVTKNGISTEIANRLYNKFLPPAPKSYDVEYLLSHLFDHNGDEIWMEHLGFSLWSSLLAPLFEESNKRHQILEYLFFETLDALEMLSIWIAAEEFDTDFLRLDESIVTHSSPFIALQREISLQIGILREASDAPLDRSHIDVLIDQTQTQINLLKKRSVNQGISLSLTYKFERLEQILIRLQELLYLVEHYQTPRFGEIILTLLIKTAKFSSERRSIRSVMRQNMKILALSVTNNASDHGEHYITSDRTDYLKMLLSAMGGGFVIALMALIKIKLMSLGLTQFIQMLLVGFNYGLGFVLIHMLGFTVATKQPAMTASTIAATIDKGSTNKADLHKLIELIITVSRSQFAAVIGNVTIALGVAFGIGYLYALNHPPILNPIKTEAYLHDLVPIAPLFFAAIAGFWLFVSGLISGYFDNRANYLNLEQRYYHHPILRRLLSDTLRQKLARYLHNNHGSFAGNFWFGMLLAFTPFLGYVFELPLDIRHIAFSSANLGYVASSIDLGWIDFFLYLAFVLMIGGINLGVSFALALRTALRARGSSLGGFGTFLRRLFQRIIHKPRDLFFPPKGSH